MPAKPPEKPEEIKEWPLKVWPLLEYSIPEPVRQCAAIDPPRYTTYLKGLFSGGKGIIAPNEDSQGKATGKLHKPVK